LPQINDNATGLIGKTPFIRLSRLASGLEPDVFAKLESFNPGGSFKERIGFSMIRDLFPGYLTQKVIDEIFKVKSIEALETTLRLACEEGLLSGISSGAADFAVLEIAIGRKTGTR